MLADVHGVQIYHPELFTLIDNGENQPGFNIGPNLVIIKKNAISTDHPDHARIPISMCNEYEGS